jgi:hypothetical protein
MIGFAIGVAIVGVLVGLAAFEMRLEALGWTSIAVTCLALIVIGA